jgi:predicted nucleic acid-binding protein
VIIADTGFFVALANPRDKHHARAVKALDDNSDELVTTWPVVTETCHLLATRFDPRAPRVFIENGTAGAYRLFALSKNHLPRMAELMERYANLPMDLADASLVILAEELGTGRILSTDVRDFGSYRWKNRKPFQNLLDV